MTSYITSHDEVPNWVVITVRGWTSPNRLDAEITALAQQAPTFLFTEENQTLLKHRLDWLVVQEIARLTDERPDPAAMSDAADNLTNLRVLLQWVDTTLWSPPNGTVYDDYSRVVQWARDSRGDQVLYSTFAFTWGGVMRLIESEFEEYREYDLMDLGAGAFDWLATMCRVQDAYREHLIKQPAINPASGYSAALQILGVTQDDAQRVHNSLNESAEEARADAIAEADYRNDNA